MTLELTTGAHRRPQPRPLPGTDLTLHRPVQPPAQRAPAAYGVVATCVTISYPPDTHTLDGFARGAYRSAAAGLLVAAAAAAFAGLGQFPFTTRTGYLLYTAVLIGAIMFVGGGIAGSARPTTGGNR